MPSVDASPIYAGLSNFGAGIGHGLNAYADRAEKEQDEAKQRARLFKSLQEYADVTGIVPKDQSLTMDLDSLKGMVEGTMAKSKLAEAEQEKQLKAAQLTEYLAQASERQRRGQSDQAAGDFIKNYFAAPQTTDWSQWGGTPMEAPQPSVDPRAAMAYAMQQTPGMGGRSALDVAKTLKDLGVNLAGPGGETGPNIVDTVDLPFGNKGVSVRGSKDLKVLTDAAKAPAEVQPGVWQDAKGNLRQFKDVQQQTQLSVLTEELKSINHGLATNAMLNEADKKEFKARKAEIQQQLDAIFNGGKAAPSPDVQSVKVVDASGRRGSVPKSQLADALKQGYKLAE